MESNSSSLNSPSGTTTMFEGGSSNGGKGGVQMKGGVVDVLENRFVDVEETTVRTNAVSIGFIEGGSLNGKRHGLE